MSSRRALPAVTEATCGAVLAGGSSRRMGRPKAFVEVAGTAMARRVADSLLAAGCSPVVAIGGDDTALAAIDLITVADGFPGDGPLGAIITALEFAAPHPVLVAACDLPWLDGATVGAVLAAARSGDGADADAVVARTDRLEPLLSWWSPAAIDHLRACFAGGERAVHVALRGLTVVAVDVAPSAVRNVNRPEDLQTGPTR